MENLETRKMMAADTGLDLANSANASDGDFAITPNWSVNRLNLIVTGTEFNDDVQIRRLSNTLVEVTAVTTNDDGVQLGAKSEVFHRNAFVNIFAVLGDGDDGINNQFSDKTMVAYGGNGDDYLRTSGRANLFGGGDNDILSGSRFNDFLSGGAGEDRMYAGGGNDSMDGGAQDDIMYGGSGNDTMMGESGDDTMYGGTGEDVMHGANGDDIMRGGGNDDIMFGGNNDDKMYGDSGNDIMRGMNGVDRLEGGSDDDRLDGGAGDDTLLGNRGDDELIGRGGFDRLFGGEDNDILDGGDDGIADVQHGGTGADIFVRHKHWGADDPDFFIDLNRHEGDKKDNDWGWANYGNDFPHETDYFG